MLTAPPEQQHRKHNNIHSTYRQPQDEGCSDDDVSPFKWQHQNTCNRRLHKIALLRRRAVVCERFASNPNASPRVTLAPFNGLVHLVLLRMSLLHCWTLSCGRGTSLSRRVGRRNLTVKKTAWARRSFETSLLFTLASQLERTDNQQHIMAVGASKLSLRERLRVNKHKANSFQ